MDQTSQEMQPISRPNSQSMYVAPAKELTMKLALYYDFMLYKRTLKPFNNFLVEQKGLKNEMYTRMQEAQKVVGSVPMVIKNEDALHVALQESPTTDTVDPYIFQLTSMFQKNVKPDSPDYTLFLPTTSEQVDSNINTLVSNIGPEPSSYDCSQDTIMTAIQAGTFDEYLSEENKQQMMKICRPAGASEGAEGAASEGAASEGAEKKGFFSFLGFGGRKRSKKQSRKRSKTNKRSKKRSKKRSTKKKSKMIKKYKGGGRGAPVSYVGSIQGKFTNIDGRQLFTNPVGGIA